MPVPRCCLELQGLVLVALQPLRQLLVDIPSSDRVLAYHTLICTLYCVDLQFAEPLLQRLRYTLDPSVCESMTYE